MVNPSAEARRFGAERLQIGRKISFFSVCDVAWGRDSVPQCAVRPFVVVETKVTFQSCVQRVPVCVVAQIYVLVFHAAPQPFDEHVVRSMSRISARFSADSHAHGM